jgi:hypothetical protein
MNPANGTTGSHHPAPETRAKLKHAIETTVLAHAGLSQDGADEGGDALRLVEASSVALRHCETLQQEAVQQARRAGRSWAELGNLMGISRQAVQQRFAPSSEDNGWFAQEWHAEYEGHDIMVRNSWTKGLKLYVDDDLVAEDTRMLAIDGSKPIMSATFAPKEGKPFTIDVVARAFINVRIKILVNGKQIGGDQF